MSNAKTLRELGVPRSLVDELQSVLKLMGCTKGEEIVGYRFESPSGSTHALKLEPATEPSGSQAA